ncbi:MAG: MoxR family ATPase [Vicinamibacteria bacterium]|nr:MoxR family ATPase [Vicinamibacteria bacterium]
MLTLADTLAKWKVLRERLDTVVLGQPAMKEHVLTCLLAGGHALLEGVPGTAKTLTALTLARLFGCRFKRIQFTPDLMPADLLGTNIYNQKTQQFEFRPGPIFADLLLADEVNRTPPRTQAALLECMQESSATVDGARYRISPVFTVLATQNPVEFEGTYPLPEAQRDRFLMKILIDYPAPADEARLIEAYAEGRRLHEDGVAALEPVLTRDELAESRQAVARGVRIDKGVLDYILKIVSATRRDESVQIGAGPRASLALLECGRARAALRERDFVTPDDIKEIAAAVLAHRVTLAPEAEMEGITLGDVLRRIFEGIEVPR